MRKDDKTKYDTNHVIGVYELILNCNCDILNELTEVTGEILPKDIEIVEKYRNRLER